MRVQHNIAALNSQRNLMGNNNKVSKSLEKLSSGYRINRAGDDAAGLAISEKMRAQISGLNQAETNANDGISLIQTAEGALTETHSILNRMKELSVQSANGTYDDKDRTNIQDEIKQLSEEIDRISEATEFNGKKLLNGKMGNYSLTASGTTSITHKGNKVSMSGGNLKASDDIGIIVSASGKVTTPAAANIKNGSTALSASDFTIDATSPAVGSKGVYTFTIKMVEGKATKEEFDKFNGLVITVDTSGSSGASTVTDLNAAVTADAGGNIGGGIQMQIGANAATEQAIKINVKDMSASGLSLNSTNLDLTTVDKANAANKFIESAIAAVSKERSNLGAAQNRLEHTINNLSTTNENLTAAESRIRDTDMAKEMMTYTKNNILSQAAQSMLAQANQQPQQVLQLLQ